MQPDLKNGNESGAETHGGGGGGELKFGIGAGKKGLKIRGLKSDLKEGGRKIR